MNTIQLTAILVLLNMTVSLCYATETVETTPVSNQQEAPAPTTPTPTPAPREYSQQCISAIGDYEIATIQQSQAKLLMDQAQQKLDEPTLNPFKVSAKSNHLTVLRANQKLFDQASEDVRKSLIRIADECGSDFDVFVDEVRTKIHEYVNQSFSESNKK